MGGIINEFFKSLKPKEKIVVISSVAALGVVLIGVVLLIAFCSNDGSNLDGLQPHDHIFNKYYLEFDAGSFNVKGACSHEDCDESTTLETAVAITRLPVKQATCTEEGQELCVYVYDGVTLQYSVNVAKKAHSFEYDTLSGNQLSGKCTAEGCNATNEITATSVVETSKTAATCKDVSKTVYTATLPDGSIVQIEQLGTDKLSTHKLNGADMDTSTVYDYADFDDIDLNCGETVDMQFVCEVCQANLVVKVERKENHSYEFDMSTLVMPGFMNTGKIGYYCTNDGCTMRDEANLPMINSDSPDLEVEMVDNDPNKQPYVKYSLKIEGIDEPLELEIPIDFNIETP